MAVRESEKDVNKAFIDLTNFLKNAFTTNIQGMIMLQEESVRMLNTFMEQGLLAPKEGGRVLHEWSSDSNRVALNFLKVTEENFDKLTQHLR